MLLSLKVNGLVAGGVVHDEVPVVGNDDKPAVPAAVSVHTFSVGSCDPPAEFWGAYKQPDIGIARSDEPVSICTLNVWSVVPDPTTIEA